MIVTVAAAVFFGCIGVIALYVSRALCANIAPADDGPPAGNPPSIVLVAASAALGGAIVAVGATPLEIGIAAIVMFALVACWCSDALCGIVPDLFTLVPLAALLLFSIAQHDWWILISAIAVFVPFAAAALFSKGYGMGWGDAKLVAISGAALGAPLALLALSFACAAAVIVSRVAKARGPIAFAPYIAAATALALPLGLAH